jgi:2-keto-3-deoxy-L-fuconate dehydrogenase
LGQDLQGKRVLVTAAAAGIGRAIAEAAAEAGASVLATDIDASGLAALARPRLRSAVLDVADGAAVAALLAPEPAFDGVVNAAGWVHHGDLAHTPPDAWTRSFAVNVDGIYHVLRATVPAMLAAGGGSVVNVASVASSLKGFAHRLAYGASKAAVIGLTKALAVDHLKDGLRANAICPGTVDSPSLQARMRALGETMGGYEAARAAFLARQPAGRLGAPEEIAGLAVYLLSDASSFLTGQALAIDGGIMA